MPLGSCRGGSRGLGTALIQNTRKMGARAMSSFPENLADRFRRFKQRHFLPNAEQYEELAAYGQTPEAMIISCSDSRVDPETIFGAMPGELFVVRNVANLGPP